MAWDWKTIMQKIYGSRAANFDHDIDHDILPEVDPDTGAVLDAGAYQGTLFGISLSLIAGLLALIFVIGIVLVSLLPLMSTPPPPAIPKIADFQANFPDDTSFSELREALSTEDKTTKGIDQAKSSTSHEPHSSFDEGDLQRKRINAALSGDIRRYNKLVEEHRKLYKKHGVDPCNSGFFPQGCR